MDRYTVPVTLFSFLLAALTQACKCEDVVSSAESDYNTLVPLCITILVLCITILVLFIAWLVVLFLIAFYYWRHVFKTRPNRNAVSHVDQPDLSEMTKWDSVQGAAMMQTDNAPTMKRYNESLLIETLVTPERPSQHLPPIIRQ